MLMRDALLLSDQLLCVSGRTSFEIVQKAIFAGVPLVGFIRGDSFNIYTNPARIAGC